MAFYTEILHDRDCGLMPVDAVKAGLAKIETATGYEMIITRETRQIKIAQPETDELDKRKINWPRLPATFSLVLTGRPIADDNPGEFITGGFAKFMPGIGVVSLHGRFDNEITSTTAHEMGHLFGITKIYEDEASVHCKEDDCIMTEFQPPITTLTSSTDTEAPLWRLRAGLGVAPLKYAFETKDHDFCSTCHDDLAERGDAMHTYAGLKMLRFIQDI